MPISGTASSGQTRNRIETVVATEGDVGFHVRVVYGLNNQGFPYATDPVPIASDPQGFIIQLRNLQPGTAYNWKAQLIDPVTQVVVQDSEVRVHSTLASAQYIWCGGTFLESVRPSIIVDNPHLLHPYRRPAAA